MVVPDMSYPITITNGDPIWSSDQCGIWVDWNQNEDFSDDTPITVTGSPGVGPYTANIIPPVDAMPGPTRMRVQIIYSAVPDPCVALFSYGEVEDYTLIVDSDFSDWLTFNPTTGTIPGSDMPDIDVTFNSTDMEEGDYYADLIIINNDPDESEIIVPCTLHVSDGISLSLKAMMEGPFAATQMNTNLNTLGFLPLDQPFNTSPWNYSGTENVTSIPNANVTDWVLVELRETTGNASAAIPVTKIGRQAAFILNTGDIVGLDGVSLLRFDLSITDNLYVVIWHRNHIGVISASPVIESGGIYNFDFTGAGQSYGTESQNELTSGIWGMISGDVNADGDIDENDKSGLWESNAGESGFTESDLNLDGQVDNKDKDDYWLPNLGKGTGVPE